MPDDPKKIEDRYKELSSQFSLPDFEKLNSAFEITVMSHTEFFLRNVRRHMFTLLYLFIGDIESIFQPDSSVAAMIESKALSDPEKEELFAVYRRLNVLKKRSIVCDLSQDDKENAQLIRDIYDTYEEVKPRLRTLAEKLKGTWEKKPDAEEKTGYFG